jgi:hypothetical protein
MQKRNTCPIDTGRRQKRMVGDIGVPKDWWDIARDLCFCTIVSEDPFPVEGDTLSEESYKEAQQILSAAIKVFDVSKAAIHTVSIRMFQALLSSTDNDARGSPISCLSALHQTGS